MKRAILIWFCSTILFSLFNVESAGSQTGYRYAYLLLADSNQGQIALVDATAPNSGIEYRALPLPVEWYPPRIRVASPDGEWAIFVSAHRGEAGTSARFVRLINMNSGEVRDLESGLVGDVDWSPDSRYLALSQDQTGVNELFVYSIEDGSTRNLTNDTASNNYITWSPDSTHIAQLSELFSYPNAPVIQLEVIEVSTANRQISPNFVDFAPISGFSCNLDWSPDGRYVSFVMGCFASVDVAREVFVWDRLQAELSQVTNFTVGAYQSGGTYFSPGFFVPAWYDADTLLIGGSYRIEFDQPTTEETYLYRLSTSELVTLFEGTTEEWARNSVTGQMAARTVTTTASTSSNISNPSLVSGKVQIFTLNAGGDSASAATLSATASDLPLGCDLAWSPDGTTLAYAVRDSDNCLGVVQRLMFVDGTTGAIQEHTPLLENGKTPYRALLIGWVAG